MARQAGDLWIDNPSRRESRRGISGLRRALRFLYGNSERHVRRVEPQRSGSRPAVKVMEGPHVRPAFAPADLADLNPVLTPGRRARKIRAAAEAEGRVVRAHGHHVTTSASSGSSGREVGRRWATSGKHGRRPRRRPGWRTGRRARSGP